MSDAIGCCEQVSRYRAHQARYTPWFFSPGAGRFNLTAPRGRLNTASSPEVVAREYLGHVLVGHPEVPETASGSESLQIDTD